MSDLLRVEDLKVHFGGGKKLWGGDGPTVHAVDGVSFSVPKGKTLGIVGESGSGKTTAALAILRLVPITSGRISLGEQEISSLQGGDLRLARRRFQIIFQDPYSSLDPRRRAGDIVREPLDLMGVGEPAGRDAAVAELFVQVGLRSEQRSLFPHQFSGGAEIMQHPAKLTFKNQRGVAKRAKCNGYGQAANGIVDNFVPHQHPQRIGSCVAINDHRDNGFLRTQSEVGNGGINKR